VVDSVIQVADKSSGEKKLNFLDIGRVGRMGQEKGSFTAKSSVKTRSGEKWFVQSVIARGPIYLSRKPLSALE
jgi:hypothetical protein